MFYSSLKPDEGDEDEKMSRVREALCNKRHQLLSTIVSCNDRYLFPKKLMR